MELKSHFLILPLSSEWYFFGRSLYPGASGRRVSRVRNERFQGLAAPCQMLFFSSNFKVQMVSSAERCRNAVATFVLRANLTRPALGPAFGHLRMDFARPKRADILKTKTSAARGGLPRRRLLRAIEDIPGPSGERANRPRSRHSFAIEDPSVIGKATMACG
jgi:hypothetical protein